MVLGQKIWNDVNLTLQTASPSIDSPFSFPRIYKYTAAPYILLPMTAELTTISVTPSVRDRVRSLKRGGQSYSDLLESMAEQYQPEVSQ